MNSLQFVGRDEPLTAEQALSLLPSAIKIARRDFVARKLLPIRFVDASTQDWSYDTLTEMAAARKDAKYPGKETLDSTNLSRASVHMNTFHKEFEIPKADLDQSRMTGTPLNTSYSDAATYQVGLLEDTDIFNALYNGAGNSDAGSTNWDTATNIPISINATIALLQADHIYKPYNLAINPTQEGSLQQLIASTAVPWSMWVKERIGGNIFVSEAITEGTGMMLKANPVGLYEYVCAEDLQVKTEQESLRAGEGLFGRAYVRGGVAIYNSNAICRMTTI